MMAGRLRELAALHNPSTTGDALSSATDAYVDTGLTVRCSLKYLNGRELEASKQTGSEITVEIFVRPDSNITSGSRLVIDSTTFEVVAIVPVSRRNRDWRLQCKAIT